MDEAYLQAVADAICAAYKLDQDHCAVTYNGEPHPNAGEWYYAVHPGSLSNSAKNYRKDTMGLFVTITMRTDFSPLDRIGGAAILGKDGLIRRTKRLAALVNMNYEIMDAANALLTASAIADGQPGASPWYLPLQFQNANYLGEKGPTWFNAEGEDKAITGLAVQLSFGGAERISYDESQT